MNDTKAKKNIKTSGQTNDPAASGLKKEVEELKRQVEENKGKYLRALADYQNLEKRVGEDRIQVSETVIKSVLLKLLPFLDNLEKAEVFFKDQGLKIIKDNFFQNLQEMGLEEIQVLGKTFDPYTSEAIDIVEGKDDNKVIEVLRKGYNYKGKNLRVAQVKVSKKVIS